MASDAIYISRAALEDALVAQAVMGADMQTLMALAINFGLEEPFARRLEQLRRDFSRSTAPLLLPG